MKFTAPHRTITAFITLVAFCWLTLVAAVPLRAENAPASPANISADESPGLLEAPAESGQSRSKSKSTLVQILVGTAFFGLVAWAVIKAVVKARYDIRGNWLVFYSWQDDAGSGMCQIMFTGDRGSGMFDYLETDLTPLTGTYSVDGKEVTWTLTGDSTVFTGEFINSDMMGGTSYSPALAASGTWTAERTYWYITPITPQNKPDPAGKIGPRR